MSEDARILSRRIIAHHSKSFALASRLLPAAERDRAVVVYAWCRRADDAVDLAQHHEVRDALQELQEELELIYGGGPLDDPILAAFRDVVEDREIPRHYPQELLEGLAMDAEGTEYDSMPRFLQYCYRVAGTVGLMMCHVMGISREAATLNATHLGVAMQITNICRDIEEDWHRNRLYVPADLLERHGVRNLSQRLGTPFPEDARTAISAAVRDLLETADDYYASGDAGISALSWRSGLAVRTARKVYSAIGARIRDQRCDPLAGRAWVSGPRKLRLAAGAVTQSIGASSGKILRTPRKIVRAEEVLPLENLEDLHHIQRGETSQLLHTQQGELL